MHFTCRYLHQNINKQFHISVCRFLATGDAFHTIAFNFRLGNATVQAAVYQVCKALWKTLKEDFFLVPSEATWRACAADFWAKWHFPNAVGALDGKHVCIQAPANTSSAFYLQLQRVLFDCTIGNCGPQLQFSPCGHR